MSLPSRSSVFTKCTILGLVSAASLCVGGCAAAQYREWRVQGQKAMVDGMPGTARYFFEKAEHVRPRSVGNLHDLGACSVAMAQEHLRYKNHPAAMRELDAAIDYYSEALEVHPGHRAALVGKNVALELKGLFGEALDEAEWAAVMLGPTPEQYIFLAEKLEQRGDVDGALLRYRQAVAIGPDVAESHVAFARFLLRHDRDEAAVHHLRAAYQLNPLDEWVMDQLARRGAVPTLVRETAETP